MTKKRATNTFIDIISTQVIHNLCSDACKIFNTFFLIKSWMKQFFQNLESKSRLTPTLAVRPLRGLWAFKSILWETLFLDQLHDFSLLSANSFLHLFLESKFMKKKSLTPKKFHFRNPIFRTKKHTWVSYKRNNKRFR